MCFQIVGPHIDTIKGIYLLNMKLYIFLYLGTIEVSDPLYSIYIWTTNLSTYPPELC